MLYKLYRAYTEVHRKYHNLAHIFRMFELAQNRGMVLSRAQVLTVWLHDVVYNIPAVAKSNEELSAETAFEWLSMGDYSLGLVNLVVSMVLATEKVLKPGVPELTDTEWQVVGLDLYDLATQRYWSNLNLLRKEMVHLSDEQWSEARSAFLLMILDKVMIIGLPFFTSQRESNDWHIAARKNIESELEQR